MHVDEWTKYRLIPYCFKYTQNEYVISSELKRLPDKDLARGPDEVFTIIEKIGRGLELPLRNLHVLLHMSVLSHRLSFPCMLIRLNHHS